MEQLSKTTEETVREVLTATYPRFAHPVEERERQEVLSSIVAVLDDPAKSIMGVKGFNAFESSAAYEVRMRLLSVYFGGRASVTATVDIFNALNRHEELGWLAAPNRKLL